MGSRVRLAGWLAPPTLAEFTAAFFHSHWHHVRLIAARTGGMLTSTILVQVVTLALFFKFGRKVYEF